MNVLKQCRHALMVYNTNDIYIGRSLNDYGEFSQEEVDLFEALIKPGMTVLDVGANIGAHTVVFSKIVGPKGIVFAYEPQRLTYYALCANIALNNLTNVYCLQNAVGNKEGRIEIPELDPRKLQNFGGMELGVHYSNATSSCSVKLIKLDSLKLSRLDFLKIDIEGMEPEAIQGAIELINKHRPIMYLESDRPENLSIMVKLIRGLNYNIHFHSPLLYNPKNYDRNDYNAFGNICSINMLCNPEEKPLTLTLDDFRLTPLRADGKVILKTTQENNLQIHDAITKDVTTSCMKAARYYSDKLFEHKRALAYTEFALRANPHDADAYHYAAQIFCRLYNYEEALKLLDAALEEVESPSVMHTRAAVLGGLGRHEEAIVQYNKTLDIDPKNPDTHFNLACSLVASGKFDEGWEEYDWRFKLPKVRQFLKIVPDIPMWDEKPLNGKRLLLFAEQGCGDTIQFIRYARHIKDAKVTLACQPSLEKLLTKCEGIDVLAFKSDDEIGLKSEDFDCMFSLISLPRVFKGIDQSSDYIVPDKTSWSPPCTFRKKDFKIGIAWAGSDLHDNDHSRSCHLKEFAILQDIPNVKLYSLQKGSSQRSWITEGKVDLMDGAEKLQFEDYTSTFNDFNDAANFIQKLDLVITVDTAVAHLAAAIGMPTWILLGFYPDHRWMMDRTDTPWYKSARLFRHPTGKLDWKKVFEDVKNALIKRIK